MLSFDLRRVSQLSSPLSQSPDLATRFPGLETLASGYVNNAWDYLYGSPQAAVLALRDEAPELVESAVAGVKHLLTDFMSESDRRAVLTDMGWGYGGPPGTLDAFLDWTLRVLCDGET